MATLGKWSGGVKTQGALPTTWTAPTSLFDTQDRNDGSAYSWAATTSTLTLPASNLPDGYLLVAAYEYEDTSNGRHTPQGRFVQASGTGNFLSGYTGGYSRDNSEDRAYVRTWAIVDNPSASATFQFQWKSDVDGAAGGTTRSVFEIIPLYYSNIGIYNSTSASLYGGTTPNQVTGFTASYQSDTAAIEIVSNVVTVKGDNKRYLALGSQFFEGRGGRTQRWHGFRVDGTKDDEAKAYSYYRDSSNDENGDLFTTIIDRATTNITIDQFCYRGDGVAAYQGGADIDGSTPSVGNHAIVVLELNDDAEVFRSHANANSSDITASPTTLDVNLVTDFNDTASFTDVANSSINAVKTDDYLFGANISGASVTVSTGARYTGYGEFSVNGTADSDTVSGDYTRNNQSTTDTFGWSANLLSSLALTATDDVGVIVTELAGSEGGGNLVSPAGWTGFWGVNLDTLEAVVSNTVVITQPPAANNTNKASYTVSGTCDAANGDVTVTITGITPVDVTPSGTSWTHNFDVTSISDAADAIVINATQTGSTSATEVTADKDVVVPVVTITAPADVTAATTLTTYAVAGTCSSGDGDVTVTVTGLTPKDVTPSGTAWSTTFDVTSISDAVDAIVINASQTDTALNTGNATEAKADKDVVIPVITVTSTTVWLEVDDAFNPLTGMAATDNIDGTITGNVDTVSTVDTSTAGEYTVTHNVSDTIGNDATEVVVDVLVGTITTEDTGFQVSGNVINVAGSNNDWTTTYNAETASDAASANNTNAPVSLLDLLRADTFDFSSIPTGATILGVEVQYRCKMNSFQHYIVENSWQLEQDGTAIGTKDYTGAGLWPLSITTLTRGGATNLWGTTGLTEADVKDSGFGCELDCSAYSSLSYANVYTIWMKVYYEGIDTTPPAGPAFIYSCMAGM